MTCRPANLVIFIPTAVETFTNPAWYILYKTKQDKAYPVFIRSQAELDSHQFKPSPGVCNTVPNPQQTGLCQLVYGSCDDPMNVYGSQTEDSGHGEQMLYLSARVTRPFGVAFPYIQQQTFIAVKHFGYFDYSEPENTSDSVLMLATFRVIPQSKWGLNKTFGTPIELVSRVINKDWNVYLEPKPFLAQDSSPTVLLDPQGRIISYKSNRYQTYTHPQTEIIYARITNNTLTGEFKVNGRNLITTGDIDLTITYEDTLAPAEYDAGITFVPS
jgi:hypothetical protein